MLTKKNVLVMSAVIGGGLLLLDLVKTSTFCGEGGTICIRQMFYITMLLYIFPFVFFLSLVTYFLPEATFRAWINFAKWWIPVQIILVAITPDEAAGRFFVNILDSQFAAIILTGLFVIISLLIILISYLRSRRAI
jgi:hypothetical protein